MLQKKKKNHSFSLHALERISVTVAQDCGAAVKSYESTTSVPRPTYTTKNPHFIAVDEHTAHY